MSQKRYVWCQTSRKLLLGEGYQKPIENPSLLQKILGKKFEGTIFKFSEVTLLEALDALDSFIASPKEFSLESKEGNRIDILPSKTKGVFYLDCWLDNVDVGKLDGKLLQPNQVQELVSYIYEDVHDKDIGEKIISLTTS